MMSSKTKPRRRRFCWQELHISVYSLLSSLEVKVYSVMSYQGWVESRVKEHSAPTPYWRRHGLDWLIDWRVDPALLRSCAIMPFACYACLLFEEKIIGFRLQCVPRLCGILGFRSKRIFFYFFVKKCQLLDVFFAKVSIARRWSGIALPIHRTSRGVYC